MLDPNTMQGAMAAQAAGAPQQLSEEPGGMEFKEIRPVLTESPDLDRWSGILDRGLERLFERQQRVVLEKAGGAKARKALADGSLEVDTVMPQDVWDKQMDEDIRPVLNAITKDAMESYSEKSKDYDPPSSNSLIANVDAQMDRIKSINMDSREAVVREIGNCRHTTDDAQRLAIFKSALTEHFTHLLAKVRPRVAVDESQRAWNAASK